MIRLAAGALLTSVVLALVPPSNAAARSRRHRRHTCGTFCRNAGGLGAPPPAPGQSTHAPCAVRTRVIRMDSRLARVSVRCFGQHTARGAVVIYPHDVRDYVHDGVPLRSYDGVDLVARPGRTATLAIPLSPQAWRRLQRTDFLRVDVMIYLESEQMATRSDIPMVLS